MIITGQSSLVWAEALLGHFFEVTTKFLDFVAGLDVTNAGFLGLLLLKGFIDIVSYNF